MKETKVSLRSWYGSHSDEKKNSVTSDKQGYPLENQVGKMCHQQQHYCKQNLSPKEFLEKYSLPRIIQVVPEEPIAKGESLQDEATMLLRGKLLMYRQYKSGKIEAKNFFHHYRRNHQLQLNIQSEHYSTVVIPDTYDGWFSVVTERGQVKAKLYTSIQQLIMAQVTAFLIMAPNLVGYVQNAKKPSDGIRAHQYSKIYIKAGQVLKLLAVYHDVAGQSTRSKRLSWPLIGSRHETIRYAQCMTSTKQVTYIPVTSQGQFYSVSTTSNTAESNVNKVYQISKLLQVFPLPVRVCTVPPYKAQGSMLLENYSREDVMLACTLDNSAVDKSQRFRFLEIDVNSKFYISKVLDEEKLFKSPTVQEALRYCHSKSDKWCQQLKVIHHIYPETKVDNNCVENKDEKKSKKERKVSLGDRKTVKSASFRYSSSYGLEKMKPVQDNVRLHNPPCTNDDAPVCLNKDNTVEESCSSLPTQKTNWSSDNHYKPTKCIQKKPWSQISCNYPMDKFKPQLTSHNQQFSVVENKKNDREFCKVPSDCKRTNYIVRINGCSYNNIDANLVRPVLSSKSKKSAPPSHKSVIQIELETPYSNVIDAIETNSASSDNTYAELNFNLK